MTAPSLSSGPELRFGLSFGQLQTPAGLARLDGEFLDWLRLSDQDLHQRLAAARLAAPQDRLQESLLLIDLARAVDRFIPALFSIERSAETLRLEHEAVSPVLRAKYKFVKRQSLLTIEPAQRERIDHELRRTQLIDLEADPFDEESFARQVLAWTSQLKSKDAEQKETARAALDIAREYAAWAAGTEDGRLTHRHSVLFSQPQPIDPLNRVTDLDSRSLPESPASEHTIRIHRIKPAAAHHRDGFALTDKGTDLAGALDQAKYCLLCHKSGKDSCSHGLRAEPGAKNRFKRSAVGEELGGCPLEERISEFHQLKSEGLPIASLAMIALDNPMVAATGHRICNDCMKACIFQQQTPVDIPQAETRVLKDVLRLPWGFEIYSLLTRWNPLNLTQPVPRAQTGKKILIVGAGPAGFTLAHYLLNDGHSVALIDGLKIEPGADASEPVKTISSLEQPLDQRIAAGFGGVAEYGITVRWDKNFLTIIRRLLERRAGFSLTGGIRFGGTLTTSQAFELGFDHIALCTGAGRPNLLSVPNSLAPGVRAASDFLMALQLTGAARSDSLANFQVRLPAVVIGGGLTAMDTATEILAYYVTQVEKFLARHQELIAVAGEQAARARWTIAEQKVAQEFIAHATAIRAERKRAALAGEPANLTGLLQSWGGVTVAYRKRLIDAPAYRLNPEEVSNALAEGVVFAEAVEPVHIKVDSTGHCEAITLQARVRTDDGQWRQTHQQTLPARSILIAAGTHPNAVLAREEPASYQLDGESFAALDADGDKTSPGTAPKPLAPEIFCHRHADGRTVSFLGDAHPAFAGNVVRAISSAKTAAPILSAQLATREPASQEPADSWLAKLTTQLTATVRSVQRLAPGIVEVTVRAPAAVSAFKPGQFYRLQNFEQTARLAGPAGHSTRLAMEGLAMTGAWTDPASGEIGLIVLEMGGSSDLCARLQPDEPVVMMGPTGMPTEIVANQNVILIGGGLGNAVLFSIGAALRQAGSKVVYIAGYKKAADCFRPRNIEAAADQVIWCCDEAPGLPAQRNTDFSVTGNVLKALGQFATGEFGPTVFDLHDADRIITIGSDRMMAAVAQTVRTDLAARLSPDICLIASINSPMQCMMKEICGQCLQRHTDPVTGEESLVFSCANQDQPLTEVDFDNLAGRLSQNAVQEKQTAIWLKHCLHRPKS